MTRQELPVLSARLQLEMTHLDRTVAMAAAQWAAAVDQGRTDPVLALLATCLHSFYNGLERIFDQVARHIDLHRPIGATSHRDLLEQMVLPISGLRPALIDEATRRNLLRYLDFRHRFRHLYFFDLAWEDLDPLAAGLSQTWQETRRHLEQFLASLETIALAP